jgi:hypothetical protein
VSQGRGCDTASAVCQKVFRHDYLGRANEMLSKSAHVTIQSALLWAEVAFDICTGSYHASKKEQMADTRLRQALTHRRSATPKPSHNSRGCPSIQVQINSGSSSS